jgi:hypothetical protein
MPLIGPAPLGVWVVGVLVRVFVVVVVVLCL